MRTLFILLMFYSVTTTSADMQDYLYQEWNEERWSCTETDQEENTCNIEVRNPK